MTTFEPQINISNNEENGELLFKDVAKSDSPILDAITGQVTSTLFNHRADNAIAGIAICFTMTAIIGNSFSFLYFRRKVEVSLPLYLYAIISAIDLFECLLSFPVIDSLLYSRQPRLFSQNWFCLPWAQLFSYFRRMSMISVMVVCLTRAIVTSRPFTNIRTRMVIPYMFAYALFTLIIDIICLSTGWLSAKYRSTESFCEIFPNEISGITIAYSILLQTEFVVPFLVVIVSFIVCTVCLKTGQLESRRWRGRRRATITIALFSCLYLVCNIPAFILELDYLLAEFTSIKTVDDFDNKVFLGWYAHLLSHFFLTLMNTALNPCLYFLRMPNYRQWLIDIRTDPGAMMRRRSKSMISCSGSSVLGAVTSMSMRRNSGWSR